jgi:hypothetical protein
VAREWTAFTSVDGALGVRGAVLAIGLKAAKLSGADRQAVGK